MWYAVATLCSSSTLSLGLITKEQGGNYLFYIFIYFLLASAWCCKVYLQVGYDPLKCPHTLIVTVCSTCPTSVATIFVAGCNHGSLSRNMQEELEAALLFQ